MRRNAAGVRNVNAAKIGKEREVKAVKRNAAEAENGEKAVLEAENAGSEVATEALILDQSLVVALCVARWEEYLMV